MTLGRHGAAAPETARRRAIALICDAKGGADPAAERHNGRTAATMKALGERFLEEYVPVHCKPSTAYEYGRSVKLYIDDRAVNRLYRRSELVSERERVEHLFDLNERMSTPLQAGMKGKPGRRHRMPPARGA